MNHLKKSKIVDLAGRGSGSHNSGLFVVYLMTLSIQFKSVPVTPRQSSGPPRSNASGLCFQRLPSSLSQSPSYFPVSSPIVLLKLLLGLRSQTKCHPHFLQLFLRLVSTCGVWRNGPVSGLARLFFRYRDMWWLTGRVGQPPTWWTTSVYLWRPEAGRSSYTPRYCVVRDLEIATPHTRNNLGSLVWFPVLIQI